MMLIVSVERRVYNGVTGATCTRVFLSLTLYTRPFLVVTPFLEIIETRAARPTLLDITARGSDMRPTASSTHPDKSPPTSEL